MCLQACIPEQKHLACTSCVKQVLLQTDLYQSKPSYNPSPRIEIAPWTCQLLFLSCPRPRASHTSAVLRAPFCRRELRQCYVDKLCRIAVRHACSAYCDSNPPDNRQHTGMHKTNCLSASTSMLLTRSCLFANTRTALCLMSVSSTMACKSASMMLVLQLLTTSLVN